MDIEAGPTTADDLMPIINRYLALGPNHPEHAKWRENVASAISAAIRDNVRSAVVRSLRRQREAIAEWVRHQGCDGDLDDLATTIEDFGMSVEDDGP